MSFLEHLEEMRASHHPRPCRASAWRFLLCIIFCYQLWDFVRAPATDALTKIGVKPPNLVINEPMEAFFHHMGTSAAGIFAVPCVALGVVQSGRSSRPAFFQKEKKGWPLPFVLSTAGLFILGGCFAYFVAFPLRPRVSARHRTAKRRHAAGHHHAYFDLFVNVMLGVARWSSSCPSPFSF